MENFKLLPEEITLDILTRLPTESVLDCKSVCQTWNNLVSQNPSFSKKHSHHLNHPYDSAADSGKLGFIAFIVKSQLYYFEYDENVESIGRIRKISGILPSRFISIIGSFDGLICFAGYPFSEIKTYVCNPITKEYIMLPEIKKDFHGLLWTCGFGYVSSTDEYKVVVILLKSKFVEVYIYTLGSGTGWRNLGRFNLESNHHWNQGVFLNGVLYWMEVEPDMIFTFDLTEEKFGENISPPPLPSDSNCCYHRIGVSDGFLFLAVYLLVGGLQEWHDIWLLKKKNNSDGMTEQKEHQSWVWSKEFRVDGSELVAVTKTGGVLTFTYDSVYIYDPKPSTSKVLVDFEEQIRQVFPHKNTLASLKELGEEDTKIMESVEVEDIECHDLPWKQLAIGG